MLREICFLVHFVGIIKTSTLPSGRYSLKRRAGVLPPAVRNVMHGVQNIAIASPLLSPLCTDHCAHVGFVNTVFGHHYEHRRNYTMQANAHWLHTNPLLIAQSFYINYAITTRHLHTICMLPLLAHSAGVSLSLPGTFVLCLPEIGTQLGVTEEGGGRSNREERKEDRNILRMHMCVKSIRDTERERERVLYIYNEQRRTLS